MTIRVSNLYNRRGSRRDHIFVPLAIIIEAWWDRIIDEDLQMRDFSISS